MPPYHSCGTLRRRAPPEPAGTAWCRRREDAAVSRLGLQARAATHAIVEEHVDAVKEGADWQEVAKLVLRD